MRPGESFVGQPIRSLQTMLRTIAEDRPGYIRLIPDGIYGPETGSAVSHFQRRHGIRPTGVTDQETWEAIVQIYETSRISRENAAPLHIVLNPGQVIRKGERHPSLWLVQAMLQILAEVYGSIESPSHSGLLDEETFRSLASFQQLSRLPMTGHLDKQTWKHLTHHYPLAANLYQSGRP